MRVLLRGDLDPYAGDCLGLIRALLKRGAELHLQPLRVVAPIPADAAVLLTLERYEAYDLILHLCSPQELGLGHDIDTPGIKIAWTASPPEVPALHAGDPRMLGYDLIVGYDTDTLPKVLSADHTGASAVVHGGVWPKDWPAVNRDFDAGHFAFTMMGEFSPAVVEVFTELREQYPEDFTDVELNISTDTPVSKPVNAAGVSYYAGYWDADTLADYYADQHVLIALPKAKDNHALEFLSTGGTVIGTRTSSSAQWLSSTIGWPVDWDMHTPGEQRQAFKDTLRHIVAHRDEVERRAQRAPDMIADLCGWDPVLDRLLLLIADLLPGKGERLLHTSRVAQSRAKERTRR